MQRDEARVFMNDFEGGRNDLVALGEIGLRF